MRVVGNPLPPVRIVLALGRWVNIKAISSIVEQDSTVVDEL